MTCPATQSENGRPLPAIRILYVCRAHTPVILIVELVVCGDSSSTATPVTHLMMETLMEPGKFDALARSLASRRAALGSGLALLAGFTVDGQEAAAKCKSAGAKCGHGKKCCNGARCKGKRCRCKAGHEKWAGVCCKHRFALQDDALGPGDPHIPGTEFCCPAADLCPRDDNLANDDCCQGDETCLNGECCCDGCRGTVVCGGVCCGSDSCCNGVCCDSGEVCAEKDGEMQCVPGQVACVSDAECASAETCLEDVCCSPDRVCLGGQCCGPDHFCDLEKKGCCPNGVGCTTGKKVRIRV